MKRLLLFVLLISGFCFGQKYEGMEFYDNGKPKVIKTYKVSKDKIELVKEVGWFENGQKKGQEIYKNGKRDGKWTKWRENGQKWYERTYKDGKKDGLYTEWYKHGQKSYERTYKDGKRDGKSTRWYENGQKSYERTYKDGELISEKDWNRDGSVRE